MGSHHLWKSTHWPQKQTSSCCELAVLRATACVSLCPLLPCYPTSLCQTTWPLLLFLPWWAHGNSSAFLLLTHSSQPSRASAVQAHLCTFPGCSLPMQGLRLWQSSATSQQPWGHSVGASTSAVLTVDMVCLPANPCSVQSPSHLFLLLSLSSLPFYSALIYRA